MDSQLLRYSRDCAQALLGSEAPQALARSQRAAQQAATAVALLGRPRGDVIVSSAWLHAIGDSPSIRTTGFTSVDGAVYLLAEGWPTPVINLVAHQGQARLIAPAFDAVERLALFERIQGWPSDILDYAITLSLTDDIDPDPETCLRLAAKELPATLRITARDRVERERRLRRAVDRVSAATIAARSPAHSAR